MSAQYDPSDDTVADILKKDAKLGSYRYAQVGLQALLPKRPTDRAPKPNTRFLRNILRDTGNHNAALLAKEAEESQARLQRLREKTERLERREEDRSRHRRHDREDGQQSKRRRLEEDSEEDASRKRHVDNDSRTPMKHDRRDREDTHRRRRKHEESNRESDTDKHKRRKRHKEFDDEINDESQKKRHKRHKRDEQLDRDSDVDDRDRKGRRRQKHPESRKDSDADDRDRKHKHRKKHKESDDDGGRDGRKKEIERDRKREQSGKDDHKQHQDRSKIRRSSRDGPDGPDDYPTVSSRKGRRDDGSWRHIRFASQSPSRSKSPNREVHKQESKRRRSSTGSSLDPTQKDSRKSNGPKNSRQEEAAASDSDPLEAIVGPMPKSVPQNKIIKFRGRGAFSTTTAIDSHFASTYDPSTDVRPNSDEEDEWGLAVEAFRDRQKWKQQGAERLKAAGFTDEQVKRWEKGGEKTEEDVKWSKKGEGREWDRGKVVDEDGDVDVQAEWGRLKGT